MDKNHFEQSLLRRFFKLLDEIDCYYVPPIKQESEKSIDLEPKKRDEEEYLTLAPTLAPPPTPNPNLPTSASPVPQTQTSASSVASTRKKIEGFMNSCTSSGSKWRNYIAPAKSNRSSTAPAPSAPTAAHAPEGETSPIPRIATHEASPPQDEISQFLTVCLESTDVWRTEYVQRIEHAFGVEKRLVQADGNVRMLSPTLKYELSEEEKCETLLKLLAISIPGYGFDARVAAIMDAIRYGAKLSRKDYMEYVEFNLADQLKKGYLSEKEQDLGAQSPAMSKWKKNSLVGLAVVAGGVALAMTAGMAAPVVLPVFATVFGAAYLAGATATTLFVAVFGVGGASLTGYRMERRYRDIKQFAFISIAEDERMRIAIGISGWLSDDDGLITPWTGLAMPGVDALALKCEPEEFKNLKAKLDAFVAQAAVKLAATEALKTTALSAAVTALAWPVAVIQAGKLIDNRTTTYPTH